MVYNHPTFYNLKNELFNDGCLYSIGYITFQKAFDKTGFSFKIIIHYGRKTNIFPLFHNETNG